jgi:hypothetical protein
MNTRLDWIWKETVMAYSIYHRGILLEGEKKTTKYFSKDSQGLGRDSKPAHPEY